MDDRQRTDGRSSRIKASLVLRGLVIMFGALVVAFLLNSWGRQPPLPAIPLVDPAFLRTATNRRSYADLVRAKEDLSDFDCYACHEKGKPPTLRFDEHQNLIIPQEHSDIVMGHGSHDRNNNCFNCHNEQNLLTLQSRDGHEVKFDNIPQLCGSCHGPTYKDWEAGAHGRISGSWDHSDDSKFTRLSCANCHNPHAPKIPTREPAPPPHLLRASETAEAHH